MQIQKTEIFIFGMAVQNHLLDCENRRMVLRRRVDVASVEVDAVRVDSVMSTGHAVRVEDGKDVEDKLVPQKTGFVAVLAQLVDYACHDVRAGYLAGMHAGADYDAFLLGDELFGLIFVCK